MRLTPPTKKSFWTACFFTLLAVAVSPFNWTLTTVCMSISNVILLSAAIFTKT